MKLIVGLGNPGLKYEKTRHNLGFMVLDSFVRNFEQVNKRTWEESLRFKSDILQIEWKPKVGEIKKALLMKPKTYMNNSGLAVNLIATFYKIPASEIWVIHDDFDLPIGAMKIRFGGGSAGHHGINSIISSLNTDKFWRFRMGTGVSHAKGKIAKHKIKSADNFVLGSFAKGESGKVRELIKRGAKAIEAALEDGFEKTMNRYNTK